jgi:thiamine biosynthesis lipoprotein
MRRMETNEHESFCSRAPPRKRLTIIWGVFNLTAMLSRFPPRCGISLAVAAFILLLLITIPGKAEVSAAPVLSGKFHFHHEGILGTSFDLVVRTDDAVTASRAEKAALAEIERLRKILSSYDPATEVSRLNSTRQPMKCSPELIEVLSAYETWTARSRGAYNGQIGELIGAWRAAEKNGVPPEEATLAKIVHSVSGTGWTVNTSDGTITRRAANPLGLDSLGKGYIIGKAVSAARAAAPAVEGLLLNIGGDIFAGGAAGPSEAWPIGLANPADHADNARPITRVFLADRAISTSAAYERGYTIAGRRYSHILDPRTGFPAEGVASATVVAGDNATANALATTLCVLTPEEGLALVEETPGAECLIIAASGEQFRSAQFAALEVPATGDTKKANEAKPSLWPKDFRVTLTFALKTPAGGRGDYKRPYVAVWANNEKGQRVRTVAVWGNKERYFPDLHDWSYGEKDRMEWAASIARATRPPGRHRVTWDGRDDSGNPLPRGTYTVFLEANREHGTYAKQSAKIVCDAEPSKGLIKAATEFEEGQLAYGLPSAE